MPRSPQRPTATGGMPGDEGLTKAQSQAATASAFDGDQQRTGGVETEQKVRPDVVQQAVVDPRPVGGRVTEGIGTRPVFAREEALTRGEMDPEVGITGHERRKQKREHDCKRREQEVGRCEP